MQSPESLREFLPGEAVWLREGPFRGWGGIVEETLASGQVRVLMFVLEGRTVLIEIEPFLLRKADEE